VLLTLGEAMAQEHEAVPNSQVSQQQFHPPVSERPRVASRSQHDGGGILDDAVHVQYPERAARWLKSTLEISDRQSHDRTADLRGGAVNPVVVIGGQDQPRRDLDQRQQGGCRPRDGLADQVGGLLLHPLLGHRCGQAIDDVKEVPASGTGDGTALASRCPGHQPHDKIREAQHAGSHAQARTDDWNDLAVVPGQLVVVLALLRRHLTIIST
jgi:hypothetical protein